MPWLKLVGFVAGALLVDRALLWAEARGWLYYRKNEPSITSLSTALFQMQAIVQPEKQHIADAKLEIKEEEDDDGDSKPRRSSRREPPAPLD